MFEFFVEADRILKESKHFLEDGDDKYELKMRLLNLTTNKVLLISKRTINKRFVKNCLKELTLGEIVDCYQIDDDGHQFVVELSNTDGNWLLFICECG